MNEQVPLPDMPADPAPAPRPSAGVHVARYTPRSRLLCCDCTALIHALGVAEAPLPRPVRWRVGTGALALLLCETHKNERLEARQ